MCELFGLSTGRPRTASAALRAFRTRGGLAADNPDGWGLAYWDDGVPRLIKEPQSAAHSRLFAELCERVRSSLIIAHVRKARHPPIATMTNTHPFQRICCDREWVFAHNGLVPDIVELERASGNPVCRPAGETDSEHAFCHLLGHIAQQFRRAPPVDAPAWLEALAAVSEGVAAYGKFNFLMSDGEHLIAYGHDRLHYLEQPGGDPPGDRSSPGVMIATEPLDASEGWVAFAPGELRVYRFGRLVGRAMTRPSPAMRSAGHPRVLQRD
jgi:glutamine amidotransferase